MLTKWVGLCIIEVYNYVAEVIRGGSMGSIDVNTYPAIFTVCEQCFKHLHVVSSLQQPTTHTLTHLILCLPTPPP